MTPTLYDYLTFSKFFDRHICDEIISLQNTATKFIDGINPPIWVEMISYLFILFDTTISINFGGSRFTPTLKLFLNYSHFP